MSLSATQPASGGPTDQLCDFIHALGCDDLDAKARHAAKRHLLDTLGAIVAGSQQPVARQVAAVFEDRIGPGTVSVPGFERRFDMLSAAYLMGVGGHCLELDDGYRAGSVHPGVAVVPVLLALAPSLNVDGRRALVALVAGYEVVARVAQAIHPASRNQGFHNTSVAGVFGAATTAAVLLGCDREQLANALGLAASSAGGLFAFLAGGGDTKRLHPGHAVREGLQAALLAQRGLTGPRRVFEARDGVMQAFGGGQDAERLVTDLGTGRLAVTQCYTKPYACCRHLHPAMDALIDIAGTESLDLARVSAIEIATYGIAAAHAQVGWGDMLAAQMSFPFCAATALYRSKADLADFDTAARADPGVEALCAKISVTVDPECNANYPAMRAAKVTVRNTSGAPVSRFVRDPYGSFTNAMSDDAVGGKFLGLADPVLGAVTSARVAEAIWALPGTSFAEVLVSTEQRSRSRDDLRGSV